MYKYTTYFTVIFGLTITWQLDAEQGGLVDDCQPCVFNISDKLGKYLFFFEKVSNDRDGTIIKQITVKRECDESEIQKLDIDYMSPVLTGDQFYFDTIDLNSDGINDLVLAVHKGMTNSYAKYWLFDSKSEKFEYLDEYPTLKVDVDKQRLTSYERGGHGGMIYEAKEYQFANKQLKVVRIEKQEWKADKNIYIKTIQELKNGKLVTISEQEIESEI